MNNYPPPRIESGASSTYAPVVGTAGAGLLIEQIGSEAATLFRRPVGDLIGSPLIGLIAPKDATACLAAITTASANRTAQALPLDLRSGAQGQILQCEMLIFPMEPAPHCVFVLVPNDHAPSRARGSLELSVILQRLGRRATNGRPDRPPLSDLTDAQLHGISRLTGRELEIVTRLVDGDRVPAIAASLFLGQSTVRNHLASVFAKLGVSSQQQLLDLIRAAGSDREKSV